jgi:hypothetical protein
MQRAARVGRKANDIARIGWNFGVNQHDMKHVGIVADVPNRLTGTSLEVKCVRINLF